LSFLYSAKFWPNIFVSKMPFKIYEYQKMVGSSYILPTDCILDLGCGNGLQTCLLSKKARKVIGIDICNLKKAEEKKRRIEGKYDVEFLRTRLQDAPFQNGMFDKIFSFCVVEHIPEYVEILRLCYSYLKSGGELIISVDSLEGIPSYLKANHAKKHAVSHYFKKEELEKLLKDLVFREIHVQPVFCSNLAYRWYRKGIHNGFSYGIYEAMWKWLLLSVSEFFFLSRKSKGIFLIASCRK